ncbi:hypothetical protein GCM10027046_30610 [Uliginosibacterium flavum]|uniref:Uncharacterized protein n=1 Tax=Uliginosibacterium flavum TaxID=1396831 RepID=A0ABV2TG96_9RHOO
MSQVKSQAYLGNPEVVTMLVGRFCAEFEELLSSPVRFDKVMFRDKCNAQIRRYADIFAGRNPDYQIIEGFTEVKLPMRLRAALGEFWIKNQANWEGDDLCVFFEWLLVMLFDFIKKASGDDMLLEIMAKPSIQSSVRLLLGMEMRAA